MKTNFIYTVLNWINCHIFKRHKLCKSSIWNNNFKRKNKCKHCDYHIFIYDKIGFDMNYHGKIQTRKVLIEKYKHKYSVLRIGGITLK